MSDEYHQMSHHVAMRDGLPSAVRLTLLEESEQEWSAHPRFAGKARFFMNIHRELLDGADWLAQSVEGLLDASEKTLKKRISAMDFQQRTTHLLRFAHGHHEIEDHGYFPQFLKLYPNLEHALDLLDGDHQVLDEALNGVETGLSALLATTTRNDVAALHFHTAALKTVMHRHIHDEEEVIIPVFLRHS